MRVYETWTEFKTELLLLLLLLLLLEFWQNDSEIIP